MAKFFEKPFFKIAKATLMGFLDDKGMKLSAALAYYTIFALAPLLLLLISLAGIFLGKDAIQGKVFEELNKKGLTIIMVTHEEEYSKRTNRTITLSDGLIVSDKKN